MDGRDIGTTILPDAEVKIYLDCKCRNQSKAEDIWNLQRRGEACDMDEILKGYH